MFERLRIPPTKKARSGALRSADLWRNVRSQAPAEAHKVPKRLLSLQREITDSDDRLKRIYGSIEDGIAEQDDTRRDLGSRP